MKTKKLFAVFVALAALQTVSVTGQELFRVSFRGSARPGDGNDNATKITTRDLIEECVGNGFTAKELSRNFALVYNTTEDSIQVVNRADGSVACEVFHFEGGSTRILNGRLVRLTFVFTHGQSEANGSAVIAERAINNNKPRLNGKMQFTLPTTPENSTDSTSSTNSDGTIEGQTAAAAGRFVQANALANVTLDQKICTGTFVVGRVFVAGLPETSNNNNDNNNNNNNNNNDNTATSGEGQGSGSGSSVTTTNNITGTTGTNITVIVTTNSLGNNTTNLIINPMNPN